MIGRLTGVLAKKRAPYVLIDCQGVGYEADVSMITYYQLPEIGEKVTLWTHLQIKDDAHNLIGFATEGERRLFRLLIRVSGVGSKMALTILSGIHLQEFVRCVQRNDLMMLTRLPGVGQKTAERLLIEMRDKVDAFATADQPSDHPGSATGTVHSFKNEAIEALQALGYKAVDANKMVSRVEQGGGSISSASELIRKALQTSVQQS